MAFSNNVLREALKQISDKRKEKERALERERSNAYESNPQLQELDTIIAMKSSKMAMCIFAGKTADAEVLKQEVNALNTQKNKMLAACKVKDGITFECSKCQDTGYYNGELCDCVKDLAASICYTSLLSDMPLKDSTFDNFDLDFYSAEKNESGVSPKAQMTGILKLCKSFAENFPEGKNLLLTGRSGLGKTHLSLSIANCVLSKGYSVIYGSAQNLINEISRETFDRSGSTDKIDSVNSCDLLILDDLGTEFSTSLSSSVVYNIINTRMMRGLSTIISTNLDIKGIGDTYTERVASRIIGSYTICPCQGTDVRLQKAKMRLK